MKDKGFQPDYVKYNKQKEEIPSIKSTKKYRLRYSRNQGEDSKPGVMFRERSMKTYKMRMEFNRPK